MLAIIEKYYDFLFSYRIFLVCFVAFLWPFVSNRESIVLKEQHFTESFLKKHISEHFLERFLYNGNEH